MRSGTNCTITSGEVYSWVRECLLQAKLVKDHGWRCTAAVVLGIVLRAAARSISVTAACRDLANAPSDQAVLTALEEGLPKTLPVLERRLNECLDWTAAVADAPPGMAGGDRLAFAALLRAAAQKPQRNLPQPAEAGTAKFHAYASACIVEYGRRYTLALTWVRRHESMVKVLRRLLARIREIGLKIRCFLLDRAFFNVPVMQFLQEENLPFLMPVMFRGRHSKKRRKADRPALRSDSKPAGWYTHTMKNRKQEVTFSVLRWIPRHRDRKDGKRVAAEIAVRRLARERHSHGDSRTLPPAFRHRNELSPDAAGADLHLHAQSASAAVLSGRGVDPAKHLGMDSSNPPCRRIGRQS